MPDVYALSTTIKRECVGEFYAPKLGRNIRLEIAQIDDADVIANYLRNEFFKQAPMARTMRKFCCYATFWVV